MQAATPIRLAMFDLDGTLFDTFRANYLAYRAACGTEFPFDEAFFAAHCMSRSYSDFLPDIGVPAERVQEIHEKKKQHYPSFFSEIRENVQLFHMAKLLKAGGTHLAVVTTANRKNTEELLRYFGYDALFDLYVTQESVTAHKPSPESYQTAMRHFDAAPQACVIFEDSDIGVQAGIAAGAAVWRIEQF